MNNNLYNFIVGFDTYFSEIENLIDLVTIIIACIAVILSILSLIISKEGNVNSLWSIRFQASREIASDKVSFETYREFLEIPKEVWENSGLTNEKLRTYLLYMYPLWARSLTMKGKRKIRRAVDLKRKKEIIKKYKYHDIWYKECEVGRVIRSESFRRAWPVLKLFWDNGKDAVIAPLIEVIIDETNEKPLS